MLHVCIISETIGPYNAIGRVAMAEVEAFLTAGWRVTVVALQLHDSLKERVTWRRLYVPRRGFALQWLTGRYFIRKALGNVSQYDLIHGHQPQIADLCHTYRCHFLTRVAHEQHCLADGEGVRRLVDAGQKAVVLRAEDWFYRRWNRSTMMLFNSALTRDHFARLYGPPPRQQVLLCPAPPIASVSAQERRAARARYLRGVRAEGIIAGFLGGRHERKGYRRLLMALRGQPDIHLLMGGLHCDGFSDPALAGHMTSVGLVSDPASFYAACDVILMPSHFEPFGLVALEAASRGLPTITTPEVGALPHLLAAGAGLAWDPSKPDQLSSLIRSLVAGATMYRDRCLEFAREHGPAMHAKSLVDICRQRAAMECLVAA